MDNWHKSHPFDVRPDIACYFVDCAFEEFLSNSEKRLIGVVEIKFAASLKNDLAKLNRIQEQQPVLAWMVYGDHFCEAIHRQNYRAHLRREQEIVNWSGTGRNRGYTILKCGDLHRHRRFQRYAEIILAYNSQWWIRDDLAGSKE